MPDLSLLSQQLLVVYESATQPGVAKQNFLHAFWDEASDRDAPAVTILELTSTLPLDLRTNSDKQPTVLVGPAPEPELEPEATVAVVDAASHDDPS